ncbi:MULTISPECIES: sugar phosphate nucleotidyltransferase [Thermodesulfovibrio]|jgi:dTDP-glucose pyrophosphorylase|uniref:sugar phosphate nucleotidyltransferase n=1 Tax=Thermodesulfovibrio TaxID=28261 RepID=UPI0026149029|nr:sugar phosphate nucleotidyltransferase [Thermodesulfovibrio sp.]
MSIKKDFERITVGEDEDILTALRKLNDTAKKVLFVVRNGTLLGTITDGDIRRHILKNAKVEGYVKDIYNREPVFLFAEDVKKIDIKSLFVEKRVEIIPILDKNKRLVGYIDWADFISKHEFDLYDKLDHDIPVIIMAGGKGTRLKPFTDVLPKPLIPVGDKTAMERIIEFFQKFGIRRFFAVLNYKGQIIESYFNTVKKDYQIEFVWEKDYLGTVGGIKLTEKLFPDENFFVSNCDIFIKTNLKEVYEYHIENNAILTSITSIHHHKIPYGVVEINKGGKINKIIEKPELIFQINTGVYLLNRDVFKYIQEDKYFDMPELIQSLMNERKNVFAYPIRESEYVDIGQWEEYRRGLELIKNF